MKCKCGEPIEKGRQDCTYKVRSVMSRPPVGFYNLSPLARKHFSKRPTQHNLTIDVKQIGSKVLSVKSKWEKPMNKQLKLYKIFQLLKNARVAVLDQVISLIEAYSRRKK